jgi:uncharacterized phage-associated protein
MLDERPPYHAIAVANWFISHRCRHLTPLKLQKLIYYAHGWYLALKGRPLIADVVQAWDFGPVVPSVYLEFRQWGNRIIPTDALGTELQTNADDTSDLIVPQIPPADTETVRFLERIAKVFDEFTGAQLSTYTHQPGTPWSNIKNRLSSRRNIEIPDDDIRNYFLAVAENSPSNA